MFYRRQRGIDAWHWSKSCTKWPKANYEEVPVKPSGAIFCDECPAHNPAGAGRNSGRRSYRERGTGRVRVVLKWSLGPCQTWSPFRSTT